MTDANETRSKRNSNRSERSAVRDPSARAAPSPVRVLLVDDEPEFANTAAAILRKRDGRLEVTATTDPASALDAVETDAFDCVVSDYEMPGMDGLEFLKRVRERDADVPFVLFTGRGSEALAGEAIDAGVSAYLTKHDADDAYAKLASRIADTVSRSEADRRLADHLERMTDAFYALDDEWRFTYANERTEELLDCDRDAILGEVVWEAFPATVGTELESAYREAMETGERRDFEFEYEPLDADFEVRAYPSGTGLTVYFRDLTEQKRRERRLEALTERLRLAVEGANAGVWDWDLRTDDVRFDEGWAEMLGYDPAEVDADLAEWEDRVHPDDLSMVWNALEAHFAGETDHYQFDHRMRAKDGDWVWIRDRGRVVERDEDGSPLRMVGIHIDVTDEKERERDLERTSARLEALFEGSPDMIDIHDENGILVDANRVMAAELGYDREELVGMKVWEIDETLDPDGATDLWEPLAIDETLRQETTYRRADGSSLPVEVHVRRVDVQGEARFLASSRDISERKAYQQRIERENERLDEFASVVSHDLRNPLNVLSGYLQLARETGNESHFDRCERALDDMERLIEDVLALAREGDAVDSPEPIALAEFAARYERDPFGSVRAVSGPEASGDDDPIDVSVEAEGTVLADPGRLRRLIENLLRNAAEHGGDRLVIDDLPDGFYVADDGPGIPEAQRAAVFESGYTTSDSGTGFGLAIVKRIAEAHGWEASLTESEAGGARFEFRGVERP